MSDTTTTTPPADPADPTDDTSSETTEPAAAPTGPPVGKVVTLTTDGPFGVSKQTGVVVDVGTDEDGSPTAAVGWFAGVSGKMAASLFDSDD